MSLHAPGIRRVPGSGRLCEGGVPGSGRLCEGGVPEAVDSARVNS